VLAGGIEPNPVDAVASIWPSESLLTEESGKGRKLERGGRG
jgi:hypothetical protein